MTEIYMKCIAAFVLVAAILSGLWYVDNRGYERGKAEIQAQWDKQKAVDAVAVAKTMADNEAKLNESEKKYVDQKKINDDLLAKQPTGMFYTPTVCRPDPVASTEAASSTYPASAGERIDPGTVDLTEFEREVEQLGHDYDDLANKINDIAEAEKSLEADAKKPD